MDDGYRYVPMWLHIRRRRPLYSSNIPPLLATFVRTRAHLRDRITHTHTHTHNVYYKIHTTHKHTLCSILLYIIIYTRTHSHARQSTLTTSRMHGTLVANDEPWSGGGRGNRAWPTFAIRVDWPRQGLANFLGRARAPSRNTHTHTHGRANCVYAFCTYIISPVAI